MIELLLAAQPWHYWMAWVLLLAQIIAILAIVIGYERKVLRLQGLVRQLAGDLRSVQVSGDASTAELQSQVQQLEGTLAGLQGDITGLQDEVSGLQALRTMTSPADRDRPGPRSGG